MMESLAVPFYDPPARPIELGLPAAKMLQSINNLSQQLALRDKSKEVLAEHVLTATKMFLDAITKDPTAIVVPSGISVNRAYRKRSD